MRKWPRVEMKGDAFQIPPSCPNCMAPAQEEWRCSHTGGVNTIYTQTFYYCEACGDIFRHQAKRTGFRYMMIVAVFVALFVLPLAAIAVLGDDEGGIVGTVFGLPLIAAGAYFADRKWLQSHPAPPMPHHAHGRKFAAYYVGNTLLKRKRVYAAARPDWLNLLIALNPDAVDDEQYRAATGAAKPAHARPF